jgi:hypothetical protein
MLLPVVDCEPVFFTVKEPDFTQRVAKHALFALPIGRKFDVVIVETCKVALRSIGRHVCPKLHQAKHSLGPEAALQLACLGVCEE